MKAELLSISSRRAYYEEGRLLVDMELRVPDIRDLFNTVGGDIYIYPKSRWGMFVDRLLRK